MAYNLTGGTVGSKNNSSVTHALRHHGKKHNKKIHQHPTISTTTAEEPAFSLPFPSSSADGYDDNNSFTLSNDNLISSAPYGIGNNNATIKNFNDNLTTTILSATVNGSNDICYSTNQVLFVIGLTCFLNFAFILLIMVFVHCFGTQKNHRSDQEELLNDSASTYDNSDAEQDDNDDNLEHSRLRLASLPDNIITQSFAERYMASKLASLKGGSCYYHQQQQTATSRTSRRNPFLNFRRDANAEFSYRRGTEIVDSDEEEEEFYYNDYVDGDIISGDSHRRKIDRGKIFDNRNYYRLPTDDDL